MHLVAKANPSITSASNCLVSLSFPPRTRPKLVLMVHPVITRASQLVWVGIDGKASRCRSLQRFEKFDSGFSTGYLEIAVARTTLCGPQSSRTLSSLVSCTAVTTQVHSSTSDSYLTKFGPKNVERPPHEAWLSVRNTVVFTYNFQAAVDTLIVLKIYIIIIKKSKNIFKL